MFVCLNELRELQVQLITTEPASDSKDAMLVKDAIREIEHLRGLVQELGHGVSWSGEDCCERCKNIESQCTCD